MNRAERRAQAARDRRTAKALRRLNASDPYMQPPFSPPRKRDIGREALDAYKRGAITSGQAKLLGAFVSRKESAASSAQNVMPSVDAAPPAASARDVELAADPAREAAR